MSGSASKLGTIDLSAFTHTNDSVYANAEYRSRSRPAKAKNSDQAWELIKYFAQVKGASELAKQRDLIPANKEAAEVFKATPGKAPAHLELTVAATENGVNENFSRNIQRARAIYRPQLDLIYNGQQSAAEALGAVKDRVEQALASGG